MKKRLQGLIAGVLIGTMFTSGIVFSKQISKTAELFYNNIKIYIDGGEIVPKDANGNVVEPFTMNGTTYLPVRAISNAFGKDVEWDGVTQSVYIGKKDQTKPDNYLHKMQYNDYKEARTNADFAVINGTVEDYNSTTYNNGIILYRYAGYLQDDEDQSDIKISYPLNSQYKNFNGTILLPKKIKTSTMDRQLNSQVPAYVWIYGDNKLLYKIPYLTTSTSFKFDLDVKGVNQLTIKVKSDEVGDCYVAFTDLALYK